MAERAPDDRVDPAWQALERVFGHLSVGRVDDDTELAARWWYLMGAATQRHLATGLTPREVIQAWDDLRSHGSWSDSGERSTTVDVRVH